MQHTPQLVSVRAFDDKLAEASCPNPITNFSLVHNMSSGECPRLYDTANVNDNIVNRDDNRTNVVTVGIRDNDACGVDVSVAALALRESTNTTIINKSAVGLMLLSEL